jgi:hypothetical protein
MTALTLLPHHRLGPVQRRETGLTFAVAALGLAVLAAVAIALAYAIPQVPALGTLYVTVT